MPGVRNGSEVNNYCNLCKSAELFNSGKLLPVPWLRGRLITVPYRVWLAGIQIRERAIESANVNGLKLRSVYLPLLSLYLQPGQN
jgi:hypothetical protein